MAVQKVKFSRPVVWAGNATTPAASWAFGQIVSLDDTVYPVAAWITAGFCAVDAGVEGLSGAKMHPRHPARAGKSPVAGK